ncbi:MAG: class I SAM-dependent methyltransferase [Brevefilum sp.]|nr:class I SAM-dependent methyltransferase [Brevefilum sp.]
MLPINRSKTQARRYYDRISSFYQTLTSSEGGILLQGVERLAVQPGERLLEIGCGPGTGLKLIAETTPGIEAIAGLDLSLKMLRQSQRKQISPIPHYIQGDGAHLPLASEAFDALFSAFTLELFSEEDIHRVLGECRRVLKPNGRLGIVSLVGSPRTLSVRLYELAHRLFPIAVDCRPIPVADLLEQNGFYIQTAEKTLNWGLPVMITVSTKRHY